MPGLTNLCSVFSVEWFLVLRNPLVDTSKQFTLQLRCVMSKEKPCRFFSLSKCPGRIGQPKTPWNLVSNSGWVRLRARPVEAVIRETSGDPGVSLRPLSRLFTMPAALQTMHCSWAPPRMLRKDVELMTISGKSEAPHFLWLGPGVECRAILSIWPYFPWTVPQIPQILLNQFTKSFNMFV